MLKMIHENHADTLAYTQGYFSKHLDKMQRKELSEQLDAYRTGLMPLVSPLTLLSIIH